MATLKANTKPFLKWAGGKTQLLSTIDCFLPLSLSKQESVTYIEPFIGGGALLFHLLRKYRNIEDVVINDINGRLTKAYSVIKETPDLLIGQLKKLDTEFRSLHYHESQKELYLQVRGKFNKGQLSDVTEAAYLIFLNRTCFNGLYRENSKGMFNVPFGRYANPTICDEALIYADSELLQRVTILTGDFSRIEPYIKGYTFVYFDPPYRPLNDTSSFNSYVKDSFDDAEQVRLRDFFVSLNNKGCHMLLSNSDDAYNTGGTGFFDHLYEGFRIERVQAKRCINANPAKRGPLTELLIRNYNDCQGSCNLFS